MTNLISNTDFIGEYTTKNTKFYGVSRKKLVTLSVCAQVYSFSPRKKLIFLLAALNFAQFTCSTEPGNVLSEQRETGCTTNELATW